MSGTKVFIFAPADQTGATHEKLEDAGCELTLGKAGWHTPMGDNEDEMVQMGRRRAGAYRYIDPIQPDHAAHHGKLGRFADRRQIHHRRR